MLISLDSLCLSTGTGPEVKPDWGWAIEPVDEMWPKELLLGTGDNWISAELWDHPLPLPHKLEAKSECNNPTSGPRTDETCRKKGNKSESSTENLQNVMMCDEDEEMRRRGAAPAQTFSCSQGQCWSAAGSAYGIAATMCIVQVWATWLCGPPRSYSWSGGRHSLHDTPGSQMNYR